MQTWQRLPKPSTAGGAFCGQWLHRASFHQSFALLDNDDTSSRLSTRSSRQGETSTSPSHNGDEDGNVGNLAEKGAASPSGDFHDSERDSDNPEDFPSTLEDGFEGDLDPLESSNGHEGESDPREGWTHRRAHGNRPLPVPPFLRPEPRLRDRAFAQPRSQEYMREFKNKKRKIQIQQAPFMTAFSINPYAHALASPVRECTITGVRLPANCLLDFHTTPMPQSDKLSLLPLSLAVALVPKNKSEHKRTQEEKDVVAAHELEMRRPVGVGMYMVMRQEALQFVSGLHKTRFKAVIGKMMQRRLKQDGEGTPEWRADMGDFVLANLRKIVAKKLSFFLRGKRTPDKPGMLADLPGGSGLARLDHVEDVSCVLRLRPAEDPPRPAKRAREQEQPHLADDGDPPPAAVEADTQSDEKRDYQGEADHIAYLLSEDDPTTYPPPAATDPYTIYATTRSKPGFWHSPSHRTFLSDLFPLPPPYKPSTLYFPTLRYRDRRVPVYSLPALLGAEAARALVAGTVFEGPEASGWVTISGASGTISAQIWLGRLAWYLARGKGESWKV